MTVNAAERRPPPCRYTERKRPDQVRDRQPPWVCHGTESRDGDGIPEHERPVGRGFVERRRRGRFEIEPLSRPASGGRRGRLQGRGADHVRVGGRSGIHALARRRRRRRALAGARRAARLGPLDLVRRGTGFAAGGVRSLDRAVAPLSRESGLCRAGHRARPSRTAQRPRQCRPRTGPGRCRRATGGQVAAQAGREAAVRRAGRGRDRPHARPQARLCAGGARGRRLHLRTGRAQEPGIHHGTAGGAMAEHGRAVAGARRGTGAVVAAARRLRLGGSRRPRAAGVGRRGHVDPWPATARIERDRGADRGGTAGTAADARARRRYGRSGSRVASRVDQVRHRDAACGAAARCGARSGAVARPGDRRR